MWNLFGNCLFILLVAIACLDTEKMPEGFKKCFICTCPYQVHVDLSYMVLGEYSLSLTLFFFFQNEKERSYLWWSYGCTSSNLVWTANVLEISPCFDHFTKIFWKAAEACTFPSHRIPLIFLLFGPQQQISGCNRSVFVLFVSLKCLLSSPPFQDLFAITKKSGLSLALLL